MVQKRGGVGFYCEQVERKIRRESFPHQCHFGYMMADGQKQVWKFGLGCSPWVLLPEQESCWTVYLQALQGPSSSCCLQAKRQQ